MHPGVTCFRDQLAETARGKGHEAVSALSPRAGSAAWLRRARSRACVRVPARVGLLRQWQLPLPFRGVTASGRCLLLLLLLFVTISTHTHTLHTEGGNKRKEIIALYI